MSLRRVVSTVLKGTAYRGVSTIVRRLFDFITLAVLTRQILVEGYGVWSLSWETVGLLFTAYHLLSLGEAIVLFISRYDSQGRLNHVRRVFFYSLGWNFALSVIFYVITIFASDYFAASYDIPQMSLVVRLLGFTVVMESVIGPCERFLSAQKEFGLHATLGVLGSFLKFLLVSLFLFFGGEIVGAAIANVTYNVIVACLAVLTVLRHLPEGSRDNEYGFVASLKEMMSYSIPLAIVQTIDRLHGHFIALYLGWWATLESIGLYQTSVKLVETTHVIFYLTLSPLFPVIANMYAKNRIRDIRRLVGVLWKYLLPIAVLTLAVTEVAALEIITLIYGAGFQSAVGYLRWRIISVIAVILTSVSNTILLGAGKSRLILKLNVIMVAIFFPIQILSIRYYSALGLNVSSVLLHMSFYVPLSLRNLQNLIGRIRVSLESVILFVYSIILPLVFLFFLTLSGLNGLPFLVLTLFCFPIYVFSACVVGYVKKKEIAQLQSIVQGEGKERLYLTPLFNVLHKICRK